LSGLKVEEGIRNGVAGGGESDGIRGLEGLIEEEIMDAEVRREESIGAIPVDEELRTL